MARQLVFGDIHGGLKALEELMTLIAVQKDDQLIFLGDYVDGWSESAQVIDYLFQLDQCADCIFIKGNHDAWCEDWLRNDHADNEWLFHGGKSTVTSYTDYSVEKKRQHLDFFNRLKNYYIDDHNRLFIHAGFSSMHGPEKEHYTSNYLWDRTLWEMALSLDKGLKKDARIYPKRLLLYNEIFIGHTPTLNYDIKTPMQAANVWNIDTGAAFTGNLTVLDVNSKEFWQSCHVHTLYPTEKGRNK